MTCLLKILLSDVPRYPANDRNSRVSPTRDLFFNARIPGEIGNEKQCNMAEKRNGFWRRLRTLSPVTEQKWDI